MGRTPVIVYDGVCNLCIWSVQFIIERDPRGVFRFASLQSGVGKGLLKARGLRPEDADSVVLIDEKGCHIKSDAAIRIARRLKGLWPALAALAVVPRPIRDWGYDLIARNRYRWFGKQATCLMPSQAYLERFLDVADDAARAAENQGLRRRQ